MRENIEEKFWHSWYWLGGNINNTNQRYQILIGKNFHKLLASNWTILSIIVIAVIPTVQKMQPWFQSTGRRKHMVACGTQCNKLDAFYAKKFSTYLVTGKTEIIRKIFSTLHLSNFIQMFSETQFYEIYEL